MPGGSKAAREESRSQSARERAIYAQAEATRTMAAAQMRKAELLEEQNMLLLMTMPDDRITTSDAREYLRLRRGVELKKLRRKLAEEENRERNLSPQATNDGGQSSASKLCRHGEHQGDFSNPAASQARPATGGESEGAAVQDGDGGQRGSARPRCRKMRMAMMGSAFRRPREARHGLQQATGACRQRFSTP
jgi:hypothetical protein